MAVLKSGAVGAHVERRRGDVEFAGRVRFGARTSRVYRLGRDSRERLLRLAQRRGLAQSGLGARAAARGTEGSRVLA